MSVERRSPITRIFRGAEGFEVVRAKVREAEREGGRSERARGEKIVCPAREGECGRSAAEAEEGTREERSVVDERGRRKWAAIWRTQGRPGFGERWTRTGTLKFRETVSACLNEGQPSRRGEQRENAPG